MYDRRTRAARTADRAAAMARTEAFVALRVREVAAMGPGTGACPEAVLADLGAALSPVLAAPALIVPGRDPAAVLAALEAGLSSVFAAPTVLVSTRDPESALADLEDGLAAALAQTPAYPAGR